MRLLCLTSRLPYPPNRGDRLRVFHFLKQLSAEHQITLVSFVENDDQLAHVEALEPYVSAVYTVHLSRWQSRWNVATHFWQDEPLQTLYYRSSKMQGLVNNLLNSESFDAVYCHLLRMAPYIEHRRDVYRIIDLTDLISREIAVSRPYRSPLARRLYDMELPRVQQYERALARSQDEIWLVSETERVTLAADVGHANLHVVANGIDIDMADDPMPEPTNNSLTFVGHTDVFHNIDAARWLATEILPLVQRAVADAALRLVGAGSGEQVDDLANLPGVVVDGFVPDLEAVLQNSAVFVAPLRFAAGVQNKVLEAMAAGRPVVTTSHVNAGLRAAVGKEVLLGDDAPTLARQIVRLLRDPDLRRTMGDLGRAFVTTHYSWQQVVVRMRQVEARVRPLRSVR